MIFRPAKSLTPLYHVCRLLVMLALVLVCLSCAKMAAHQEAATTPSAPSAAPASPVGGSAKMAALEQASDRGAPVPPPGGGGSSPTPPENQLDVNQVRAQQMIIWKADYDVRVDKAATAADQFRALVEKNSGFISAQEKKVDESGNTRVQVEARVPSEKFWVTVTGLEGLGKVESGNTTSNNVTEEWVDLGARLHVKELRMAQLEALLKRAQSTDEIDKRQQEIMAVQEEIERIQGRQRFLQNQVALSTISVTFFEKGLAPITQPGPFSIRGTVLRSWYDLLVVLRVLFSVVMFLALPGAIIWVPLLLWRLARKKK